LRSLSGSVADGQGIENLNALYRNARRILYWRLQFENISRFQPDQISDQDPHLGNVGSHHKIAI
jgi:hypothetical protein